MCAQGSNVPVGRLFHSPLLFWFHPSSSTVASVLPPPPPPHYFETERPEVLVDLCSGPFQTFSFLAQEQYFPVIAF